MRAPLALLPLLAACAGAPSSAGPCASDAECPASMACVGGACRDAVRCTSNAQCKARERCDLARSVCLAVPDGTACTAAADCGNGACIDGACTCTSDGWTSYARGVFASYCLSCHSWASSYPDVKATAASIAPRVSSGAMPMNRSMPQADRDRLTRYLECGAPP